MDPEQSGRWIIEQVQAEAERQGTPLSEDDIRLLSTPMWELDEGGRLHMRELNNRVVELARSAMVRAKKEGAPTVTPRRGLRIPQDWEDNYQAVYHTELPWPISGILQNALLGNPVAGERKPWKSK